VLLNSQRGSAHAQRIFIRPSLSESMHIVAVHQFLTLPQVDRILPGIAAAPLACACAPAGAIRLRGIPPNTSFSAFGVVEEPTLPLDRPQVSCPSEPPLAIAPVFVGRCPPDVLRAMQFRVPQTAFDPVNAAAKSDDGDGSFLLAQVFIAESSRADDPGRGRRGAPDHLPRG